MCIMLPCLDGQNCLVSEMSHRPNVLTADVGVILVLVLLFELEFALSYQVVQFALHSLQVSEVSVMPSMLSGQVMVPAPAYLYSVLVFLFHKPSTLVSDIVDSSP